MYRQLRCRNTDCGSGSLASDVLLLLCRERFESKLTKELPFIFPALLILGMCSGEAWSNLQKREFKKKNVPAYLKGNLFLDNDSYGGLKGSFNSAAAKSSRTEMSIHSNHHLAHRVGAEYQDCAHFGTCGSISVHSSFFGDSRAFCSSLLASFLASQTLKCQPVS